MQGVKLLTDSQGKTTSVLIDLKEYDLFWQEVLAEISEPSDFQFLLNENNEKIAVLLDLSQEYHQELWEDICDARISEERHNEPTLTFEEVKQKLIVQESIGAEI